MFCSPVFYLFIFVFKIGICSPFLKIFYEFYLFSFSFNMIYNFYLVLL